jgi:hypothetical protein
MQRRNLPGTGGVLNLGNAREDVVEIAIKIEVGGAAVYMDGRCIRSGLAMAEADKLARDLINQSFAHPRL